MEFSGVKLPLNDSWAAHLNLGPETELNEYINHSLVLPLQEFLGNSGKNIRPLLVEVGHRLGAANESEIEMAAVRGKIDRAAAVIEAIHSGSLIIDDIQDASPTRRNAPTFHLTHGLPKALNAGNWLYFWALEQIQYLQIDPSSAPTLVFDILKLMTRAHYGQALDLGIRIDEVEQARVRGVCLASMELKTGTLFAMAFKLGLALHRPRPHHEQLLALASRFGVALQAYDDIGNFLMPEREAPSKRLEDIKLRRPTWIWAEVAQLPAPAYASFLSAIQSLPCEMALQDWIIKHDFRQHLFFNAANFLGQQMDQFRLAYAGSHPVALQMIEKIKQQLEQSYAKL